jgi:peptidoglycan/LPS O-acetylase OafA/YrhL
MSTKPPFRLEHWPSLDGLRGVSILLVLFFHLRFAEPNFGFLFPGGALGVDVFFGLSGFLITAILLNEIQQRGTVDLRRFYIRRALRLWPALVSVILFACVVGLTISSFGNLGITRLRFLSTVFYFTNWLATVQGSRMWFLGHFWSLAIEEQFYLVWPAFLLLMLRCRVSGWKLVIVIGLLIAASLLLKVWLFTGGSSTKRIFFGSDTRGDGILAGCGLAAVLYSRQFQLSSKTSNALATIGLGFILLFSVVGDDHFALLYCGATTIVSVAATLVVAGCLLGPSSFVNNFLSSQAFVWLGKRSYGMYLWHWPMYEIARLSPFRWSVVPIALGSTILVSYLSFRFIERPFLSLKDFLGSVSLKDSPARGGVRSAPSLEQVISAQPIEL